ncbi:hypothetical protein SCHPADRAFT_935764 [Schizopora paradoxa]|uniref:DUF6533 domain-containing protein n=1 Tax=Schizopora paradoxa TaxID=27342 RepID=A0A0H2SB41_9AGAM|nr:hypothetical protein SCHPADRAFT_935764 [Schizopora paradoxa]
MSAIVDEYSLIFSQAVKVKFTFLACLFLNLYDTLINLGDEAAFIWSQRWCIGKVLYLFARYTVLIDVVDLFWYFFDPDDTSKSCRKSYSVAAWSMVTGIIISEAILTLRTYAIWGQNKLILVYLIIQQIVVITLSLYYINESILALTFIPSPAPQIVACLPFSSSNKLSIPYCCVMAAELNVLLLSLYKGVHQWRRDSTPLVRTLYRDGAIYFAVLFSISLANALIVLKKFNSPYYYVLTEMQRVFHSILASRLVMNARKAAAKGEAEVEHHSALADSSKSKFVDSVSFASNMYSVAGIEHVEMRQHAPGFQHEV